MLGRSSAGTVVDGNEPGLTGPEGDDEISMSTPHDDDIGCIHRASTDDVPFMAAVLAAKRAEYEEYSPVFWRQAAAARAAHEPFLRLLVEQDGPVALVAADGDRSEVGGAIVAVPRADDWLIDDFAVLRPEQWDDTGARLLAAVRETVTETPITVVCGQHDEPKGTMLRRAGGRLAERWWVRPLDHVAAPAPAEPEGATGLVVTAPPVYDPGGQVCQVVAWDGTPDALRSIEQWSRGQGAVLAIVPVDADATVRQDALRTAGYTVASEWYRFDAASPA